MRIAFLLALLTPFSAFAETAYITDNLRLGLHRAADTSDRPFQNLESGQALEILTRDRNYAHVRLPDGVEGYVKAAYLVTDKPAKLIVSETQEKTVALERELGELKAAFAAPAATIEQLNAELRQTQGVASQQETRVTELTAEIEDYRGRQDAYKYSLPFKWVGGALLVCLLGGFLGGLWWVDMRSRKRHGGIRIY